MKPVFTACTVIVLLTVAACSSGSKKPERKKLPALNSLGISEQFNNLTPADMMGFPFSTGEMDVRLGNTLSVFHAVALPDGMYDSLAMQLIAGHQSSAVPLLGEWAKQEEKGVVIDLRSNSSQTAHRIDYTLERSGEFSIPVVFLYDRFSEARAAAFIDVMYTIPSIQCRRTGSYGGNSRQDCFTPSGASF